MKFAPRERSAYSNSNYILLARIIEKVSGKPFGQFLSERIFQPLGMTATRVNDLGDIIKNRAAGYAWQDNRLRNSHPFSSAVADGSSSLVSSASDMAKWAVALHDRRLLKQSIIDRMWTPVKLNDGTTSYLMGDWYWGFGWIINDHDRGRKSVTYSGAMPGTSTEIFNSVDDKLAVIVLTNRSGSYEDVFSMQFSETRVGSRLSS